MSTDLNTFFLNKAINKWRLFWLIATPMSIVMIVAMMRVDLSTGPGVSAMIGFSVRWAVPFIFIIVATSSIQALFPGPFSNWLLRNRKYVGLCFAVAMAWQGLFISMMSLFFRDYYFGEIYLLRDELEGTVGYIFLTAMVATSFPFGRKHLSQKQWNLIHKSSLYFLWAYAFSVYWWNLSYYPNPEPNDYILYWSGFVAFALRIVVWSKKRIATAKNVAPESSASPILQFLGGIIVVAGLAWSVASLYLQEATTAFLTTPKWSADLVLWLPYWPFEPYLSLIIMAFGATLLTKTTR